MNTKKLQKWKKIREKGFVRFTTIYGSTFGLIYFAGITLFFESDRIAYLSAGWQTQLIQFLGCMLMGFAIVCGGWFGFERKYQIALRSE